MQCHKEAGLVGLMEHTVGQMNRRATVVHLCSPRCLHPAAQGDVSQTGARLPCEKLVGEQ